MEPQVGMAKMASLGPRAFLAKTVKFLKRALQGNLVLSALLVLLVPWGNRGYVDLKGPVADAENMALMANRVNVDFLGHRDHQVGLVAQAPLALRERMAG